MNNKKFIFGSNLKMYKNIKETTEYLSELQELTKDINRDKIELFIIPSFTSLPTVTNLIDHNLIKIGAQNMCWEDKGTFTGEISPLMLKELNLEIVMIGHSERRNIFNENSYIENKKILAAIKNNLTPLLCIGETGQEKEFGISNEVIRSQIKIGLKNCYSTNIIIAYEPTWAIGEKGTPPTSSYVEKMHGVIRQTLVELYNEKGKDIIILYGGSVNSKNASELASIKNVNGLFIGRSAWNAREFNSLLRMTLLKDKSILF